MWPTNLSKLFIYPQPTVTSYNILDQDQKAQVQLSYSSYQSKLTLCFLCQLMRTPLAVAPADSDFKLYSLHVYQLLKSDNEYQQLIFL